MSFTAQLKGAEGQYKLVRKVLDFVCTSHNLNFEAVWSSVSNRETDYFDRHFKRQKRRNDPLHQVKKPRTAFSFFTQANRNDIQTKHPQLSFGEVSKLVGEQWKGLDEKSRARYLELEAADKARYSSARQTVIDHIAVARETAAATTPVDTSVIQESASVPAPRKEKKAKVASTTAPVAAASAVSVSVSTTVSRKEKKAKTPVATTAAVVVTSAPVTAVATETASAAAPVARKEKKAKAPVAVAPVVAAAAAAPVVAAAAPVVAASTEVKAKKQKVAKAQ